MTSGLKGDLELEARRSLGRTYYRSRGYVRVALGLEERKLLASVAKLYGMRTPAFLALVALNYLKNPTPLALVEPRGRRQK